MATTIDLTIADQQFQRALEQADAKAAAAAGSIDKMAAAVAKAETAASAGGKSLGATAGSAEKAKGAFEKLIGPVGSMASALGAHEAALIGNAAAMGSAAGAAVGLSAAAVLLTNAYGMMGRNFVAVNERAEIARVRFKGMEQQFGSLAERGQQTLLTLVAMREAIDDLAGSVQRGGGLQSGGFLRTLGGLLPSERDIFGDVRQQAAEQEFNRTQGAAQMQSARYRAGRAAMYGQADEQSRQNAVQNEAQLAAYAARNADLTARRAELMARLNRLAQEEAETAGEDVRLVDQMRQATAELAALDERIAAIRNGMMASERQLRDFARETALTEQTRNATLGGIARLIEDGARSFDAQRASAEEVDAHLARQAAMLGQIRSIREGAIAAADQSAETERQQALAIRLRLADESEVARLVRQRREDLQGENLSARELARIQSDLAAAQGRQAEFEAQRDERAATANQRTRELAETMRAAGVRAIGMEQELREEYARTYALRRDRTQMQAELDQQAHEARMREVQRWADAQKRADDDAAARRQRVVQALLGGQPGGAPAGGAAGPGGMGGALDPNDPRVQHMLAQQRAAAAFNPFAGGALGGDFGMAGGSGGGGDAVFREALRRRRSALSRRQLTEQRDILARNAEEDRFGAADPARFGVVRTTTDQDDLDFFEDDDDRRFRLQAARQREFRAVGQRQARERRQLGGQLQRDMANGGADDVAAVQRDVADQQARAMGEQGGLNRDMVAALRDATQQWVRAQQEAENLRRTVEGIQQVLDGTRARAGQMRGGDQ